MSTAYAYGFIKTALDRDDAVRAAQGVGGATGITGAGAILATGLGKSAPSLIDVAHHMYAGPSGEAIFQALASFDPAGAARLQSISKRSPSLFKLMLAGVRIPGISTKVQMKAREYAFSVVPDKSRLGDVLVRAYGEEFPSRTNRIMQGASGTYAEHVGLGMPERMNEYLGIGAKNELLHYKLNPQGDAATNIVLRTKRPVDEAKLTSAINDTFLPNGQPLRFDPARKRRITAQELVGTPWSDYGKPTFLERVVGRLFGDSNMRKRLNTMPGLKNTLSQVRGGKLDPSGHVCSTAAGCALKAVDPSILGRKPGAVTAPADFLRRIGKDFDVVAVQAPSKAITKSNLLANHLLKHGPMATRALAAAPFAILGGMQINKAVRGNKT